MYTETSADPIPETPSRKRMMQPRKTHPSTEELGVGEERRCLMNKASLR